MVRVEDPSVDETIPRGKQYWLEESGGIWYTRTTGIWQTVWLEAVEPTHIENVKFTPDLDKGDVTLEFVIAGDYGKKMRVIERYNKCSINLFNQKIFRTAFHHHGWTWTPENPKLFDVSFQLTDKNEISHIPLHHDF